MGARERRRPVDDVHGALAVRLYRQRESGPIARGRVGRQRFDHVQRKVEAVGLFRVDVS